MPDGVVQPGKRAIVKEGGLQRRIAKRRRPELVAVCWVAGDLFEAEILVLPGPVEHDVPPSHSKSGRHLRNANHMILEIGEHFIGLAAHRVTLDTPAFSEKNEPSPLLGRR